MAFRPVRVIKYHRLKFCLAKGWLPPEVDHEDRSRLNNLKANLRAATHQQNCLNRQHPKKSGLPRCVHWDNSQPGKPYRAMTKLQGKRIDLGRFASTEAASEAIEAFRREQHGEFYADPKSD